MWVSAINYLLEVSGHVICTLCAPFQLKRLKLRKNNWDADTYEFDEVLTEFASQKRVYEVVAKPVVEVCLSQRSTFCLHLFLLLNMRVIYL